MDEHAARRPGCFAEAAVDDHLKAVGLYEAGMLAFWQGADEDACSLHGRSLQLARRLGDPTTIALALCGLARVALREDLDWARTLCEEALQTVEATDDRLGRANALHVLGVAAQMRGDLGQARDLMTRRIEPGGTPPPRTPPPPRSSPRDSTTSGSALSAAAAAGPDAPRLACLTVDCRDGELFQVRAGQSPGFPVLRGVRRAAGGCTPTGRRGAQGRHRVVLRPCRLHGTF